MRLFHFNEIPFIDFMSSHMFSEQFYGIIHHLLFGYDGSLDFISYKFLYFVLYFAVGYYFLSRLLNHVGLALLFLMSFPMIQPLFDVHLFAILAFFIVRKLVFKQDISHYLLLFVLIIFLFIWRIDSGVVTTLTILFFLPLTFFIERQKVNVLPPVKAVAICILVLGSLLALFSILRSPAYLWANFNNALHYFSANQAHGYSSISKVFNQQFYLFHIIYPATAVLLVIYIVYRLRNSRFSADSIAPFALQSALFFYIVYFANFQRGLVRHSFMEYDDTLLSSTFYVATVLLLLAFLKIKSSYRRYVAFFSLSFMMIVTLKYFPVYQGKTNVEKLLTQVGIFRLDEHFNEQNFEGKIKDNREFADRNYTAFKQFLDAELSPEQTFLDFSNTPMLYYYCQRKVPAYFCQSLQNTVDDYLQLDQLKRVDPKKVPVVVYSHYPPNWWDNTDGVPNAMRHYLIAEYIYRHYKPYGIINQYSVWIHKGRDFQWDVPLSDTLAYSPKTHHYKQGAAIIHKHFEQAEYNDLQHIGEAIPKADSEKTYLFGVPQAISSLSGIFATIIMEHPIQGQEIKMEIMGDKGHIGTITFTGSENDNAYMVRLSNHYLWHIDTPRYLNIPTKKGTSIVKVEFYKDSRNEGKKATFN